MVAIVRSAPCIDPDQMTLTIKESSPLDNLTKPGSTAGSSESNSEHTTRSNPVCLEVSVTIRSLPGDKGDAPPGPPKPAREEARTVIVFDNGAVLRVSSNFPPGQAVIVTNPEGRDIVCRVISARNLPTVRGYVEVEFLEPATDYWGIHKPASQANVSDPAAAVVIQQQTGAQPQIVPSEPPRSAPPEPTRVTPTVPETAAQPQIIPSERLRSAPPEPTRVTQTSPETVAQPQIVPSEPPRPAPPTPVRAAQAIPETAASPGHAPSFEDIAGLMPMSPLPIARGKVPTAPPRLPVSRKTEESTRGGVEPAKPHSFSSAPVPVAELTSFSSTSGNTPDLAQHSSTSDDFLGKFSNPHTTSDSASNESRSKTPLIVAGAAVLLIGLGTGLFFMRQGSSVTPSAVKVPTASQPAKPEPLAPKSAPPPAVTAKPPLEQARPISPPITPVSSAPKEIAAAEAPSAPPATRRQPNNGDAKQPDLADATQPDRPAPRSQPAHDLKMSAPTPGSRAGRLVDGSVPNIAEVNTTSAVIGKTGEDLIPTVSRVDSPPAPPVVLTGPSSAGRSSEAKLISSTRPTYPTLAKQSNVEGDVLIAVDIDATGKVTGAKATAGPVFLRQAAVDAVRNWKYEPATVSGKPTSTQITVKIQFRLK
jgi:protein TonB